MRLIITVGLLSVIFVTAGCAPDQPFDSRLRSIVKPYVFNIVQWESRTIPQKVSEGIFSKRSEAGSEVDVVNQYFAAAERIRTLESELEAINAGSKQDDVASLGAELDELQQQRAQLEAAAERIIAGQIKEVLTQQGIYNPVTKSTVSFPPLSFTLEQPPHLLVVSPRERIESMREIMLRQSIGLEQVEDIEASVDQLSVSSLVVELGGFGGTFPSFVSDKSGLRHTINTATEEWLHHYLALTPLGFLYLLDLAGVSRDYDIATMNETVASMVSKEIGSMVYAKYYLQDADGANQNQGQDTRFDFNREMRQIRRAVEEHLARGEIEQAEEFMEEKRKYLASKGYYIRKLNQAYFAFYGTYADSPTSISPIGLELKRLREKSASVKDFLDRAARMTSREDLRESIK